MKYSFVAIISLLAITAIEAPPLPSCEVAFWVFPTARLFAWVSAALAFLSAAAYCAPDMSQSSQAACLRWFPVFLIAAIVCGATTMTLEPANRYCGLTIRDHYAPVSRP